ncbi:MAG: hypothetical protein ACR2RB_16255 [Gammaproteobacteria bacterium]
MFYAFLQQDPQLLREIENFGSDVEVRDGALVFTIPALFEFACRSLERCTGETVASDRDSYLHFRKSLYDNPTNSMLRKWGGFVEVASVNTDHDLSKYKLIHGVSQSAK